jgi:pullulanase-type alpha-1,6-glucosidase
MNRPRHYRWLTLLALFGALLSTLGPPSQAPAQAAGAQALEPGDAQLVRPSLQHPIQDSVFYFVLPDRFSNGDPANDTGGQQTGTSIDHGFLLNDKGYYHGGDLAGLAGKLDYLQGLGVNAIWMTPTFKNRAVQGDGTIAGSSAGYHGYWITDFTEVDPHLGSNAELQSLIAAAHSRGMKVFFDIITNHTADVIAYPNGQTAYLDKTTHPYKDASGNEFDDADYAGTDTFPPLDPNVSFPYKPTFKTAADQTIKLPDWLDDPIYYHNRGDSSFSGENSTYGDFFGLDDLFTEHPDVVDGMIDIYKSWIDLGIDGYRIDTVKHVNLEFWQKFGPAIMDYAKSQGKNDFFMYGEVFDGDPAFMSQYTTAGKLPATLDFGFQGNALGFASRSQATNDLRDYFARDDYFTDADSNAYSLPTFLGNHDMGRVGMFLRQDNAGSADALLLDRDKLAHALMFFARGMPVVYYGDEQGFTGDGGDKDARQDMFPSQVTSYNDDDLIGTPATTADDNFDANHPLYQALKSYADIREAHKALRRGAQIHRFSEASAGVYAFSRIDRDEQVEYIVALNNAGAARPAAIQTFSQNAGFTAIYPAGAPAQTTDGQGKLNLSLPALGFAIYKADAPIAPNSSVPTISLNAPAPGALVRGRVEIGANIEDNRLAEVTFAVKIGGASEYTIIGTDNNAPYRVFSDTAGLPAGTPLLFKAIVNDVSDDAGANYGALNAASVSVTVGEDRGDNPDYVTIAGSLQSELECSGDWQPECPNTRLDWDPDDDVWQNSFNLLAGAWEYKAALNNSWDENYGKNAQPGGENISLSLGADATVKFYYDHKTHWVTDNKNSVIAVAPGSFQSEIGCPGDWDPGCLRSWLQDPDGDGSYSFTTSSIPPGSYEAKAAINESWDENYGADGAPGGANIPFTVTAANTPVTFTYDAQTHVLTIATGALCSPAYAIVHYQRPAGDYAGWGLHLWGDAIDPGEATQWNAPKLPNGENEYGVFWYIKLQDASKPVNFIVHKGDEKDTPDDRSFEPSAAPQIWLKQGDAASYASAAEAVKSITFRYHRPAGDYAGWGLHLWGDAIDPSEGTSWESPKPFTVGADGWASATVKLADATKPVNFIVHKGDEKDTPDDRSVVPADLPTGNNWLAQGDARNHPTRGAALNTAIIHYHRDDGDYGDATSSNFNDFWGMHIWTGAANPNPSWQQPLKPARQDAFGLVFEVPLAPNAAALNYILHRGDTKDLPEDQQLDLAANGYEVWILESAPEYLLPSHGCEGPRNSGDLSKQKAHWIDRDTIAVNIEGGAANTYALHYDPTGGIALDDARKLSGGASIPLSFAGELSADQKAKWPHLSAFTALKIGSADQGKVADILKGQIAVAALGPAGNQIEATGVQIPGVLDDLYAFEGQLGVIHSAGAPTLKLWAPTARSVKLHLFDSSAAAAATISSMTGDATSGVWSITGNAGWNGKFYLYEVEVYVESTGKVEHNLVTDPYSLSLSTNSRRSQIVDLSSSQLKPPAWDVFPLPPLVAPEDIVIYELHVRDFSINDTSVPADMRGTFSAFTRQGSDGMRHLRQLSAAGLSHVHLLPAFDCASIEEDKSKRQEPNAALLATYPPDSDQQAEAVEAVKDQDGFNWCYDPYHYTAPEGSYARNPDGSGRILEFRQMVESLHQNKLRVVMDVVYNHTSAAGQSEKSVLDRIVPGYYHRRSRDTGVIEVSTCCQNTATEHAMMEKLMIDSVLTWAKHYKVDGFRFDLMGHHMKANMLKLRAELDKLTRAKDGVDGKKVYLYGEGWNFGEVADNARGANATQLNMAGTGIGTFSDRLRDAVRGGGPFDRDENKKIQGFVNGLFYDPNALPQGAPEQQKARLLLSQDQIKVGLAGNLADYALIDRNGDSVTGAQVDYNGSPAGYAQDPQEVINYVEAHDNETLFDKIQYAAPIGTPMQDRVRMQNLGIGMVMLAQGVPFIQAGQELLRSKSLDRNSYNSGDWFNRLDWTYNTNNWGVGLPPNESKDHWPVMQPLLANPALKPAKSNIVSAKNHFLEMLLIRQSSRLFRLTTEQEIMSRVTFLNSGPDQLPGLIVMCIDDSVGADVDPLLEGICVLFNANDQAQSYAAASFKGQNIQLHPVQALSSDSVVRTAAFNSATGTFSVPARTTAVFVRR